MSLRSLAWRRLASPFPAFLPSSAVHLAFLLCGIRANFLEDHQVYLSSAGHAVDSCGQSPQHAVVIESRLAASMEDDAHIQITVRSGIAPRQRSLFLPSKPPGAGAAAAQRPVMSRPPNATRPEPSGR